MNKRLFSILYALIMLLFLASFIWLAATRAPHKIMTAPTSVKLVGLPLVATHNQSPPPAPRLEPEERENLRWEALAMVESASRDIAVGKAGEVGRYQMLPNVWRTVTSLSLSAATNPATALSVAKMEMGKRTIDWSRAHSLGRTIFVSRNTLVFLIQPSAREWFLLWHCPAHVENPNAVERDYAQRCLNLLQTLVENNLKKMVQRTASSSNLYLLGVVRMQTNTRN